MLITKKVYSDWKDLVLSSLDVDKILPVSKPLKLSQDFQKVYKRAEWHARAKEYKTYDLLKRTRTKVEREIPEEYKRGLTFNDAYITLCPNPFSLDLYRGGSVCYGCSYCFSIRCIPILLSAFYDNWKKVLNSPVSIKAVAKQFRDAPYKDDMVSRAINRRLVLHVGNNIENYIPHIESKTGIGYDFMTMMKDQDYPFILNTKSDIWDSPKFFKLLGEIGKNVMVQLTVITPYDDIAKKIEPFAPSVTRRLECAKTLNESGIKAVVRSEPYMFTISPTDEKGLNDFSDKLLDAKVPYINVGAYNTSVQSEEISSIFAQSGYSFSNLVNSQKGFYQTLVLEKALFHFREKGLKVGSFNPATYALQDASDCCGFNFQDEPMRSGSDRFNTVEVAREIMTRGHMSWDELLRWAQPIYSPQYIERFREFWENKPFVNVWWGNWSFGGRVHGMVPDGENGYRFDPEDILEKRRHMTTAVREVFK